MVALSLMDDAEDEWTDGGIVVAETAVHAEERFIRDLEARGHARSHFHIRAYPLD